MYMINGTRYTSSLLDSRYDAIVIGSGLGGLTTAALLSKAGKKVLVLERHYTAGGFTHSFKRRGYEWDVGVHYIGDVHKPYSPLRITFDAITNGQLKWAKMDDVYDKIIIQDQHYDFVAGTKNFKEELLKSFPNGKRQIDDYITHIRSATRSMPAHFGQRFLPPVLQKTLGPLMNRVSGNYFNRTTQSVMAEFVQDPKLASVLCGQWGDYGLTPAKSSFAMHSVVATHYLGGGNFPVGGASQIARHILPVIEASGGKVLVHAEVEQIMVDGGRAIGVRMANGDEILSDTIISAAGVKNTYGKMLPEEVGTRYKLKDQLTKVPPSVAHLGLYIGLKGTTEELQLQQANRWIYLGYDHDANVQKFLSKPNTDFPLFYLSFPSAKDPAWSSHYPGKSTIDVITLAPYEWFKPWENKPWKNRGADYEAFKEKMAQVMLEKVYQQVPQVRGKVDYYEVSTPLSTAHFNNYAHGEVYGLDHTPDRFAQSWIKPQTPIKGLHLTGQDILFCGVASAMMSGVMTAATLLGPRMAMVLPELIPSQPKVLGKLKSYLASKPTLPKSELPVSKPVASTSGFVAQCIEVVDVTHDVKAFRFTPESGTSLQYQPGQFVTLELELDGKKIYRSYTMSSTPTKGAYFEVTVKRVENGVMSNWLCDYLGQGAKVRMTGPYGKFTCAPKPATKLLMLSAGSGVTPMLSMSRWLVDQKRDVDVVYFHNARTQQDVIFGDEVTAMAKQNPKFKPFLSLTRNPKDSPWAGLRGYLDENMLQAIAPDFKERQVFICGPQGFMQNAKNLLMGLGFPAEQWHEESFDVATSLNGSGGSVVFVQSGTEIACTGQQSILEVAEQAGISIGNACRTGDCGECKLRKLDGDVVMSNCDGLDPQDLKDGYILTCVAAVNGRVTLEA
jgi:all-trans-retinol 13,14-reductase